MGTAVRRGEDVGVDALAPATVQWSGAVRWWTDRERNTAWVGAVFSVLLAGWGLEHAVDHALWLRGAGAVTTGILGVWWSLIRAPAALERRSDRAWAAEGYAQRRVWREHRV